MARSTAGALLFLIAGIGLVFANALAGSFHYDDFHSLVLNPHVRSWENAASFFTDPSLFSVDPTKAMYRPLVLLTYTVNHALGGYSPTGYLFVNLVLHLGCALLVWALARRLGAQPAGALWGAALFGLYPLCTEPVNYVSSRSESLAVLFQLVAFYCFLTGDSLRRRGIGWLSFMLALLSKSVAFVLPAVFIAYEVFWRRERIQWERHAPYWALSGIYLSVIFANRFLGASLANAPRGLYEQLLTQSKALIYYAYIGIFPTHLNVEHQFYESSSLETGCLFALLALGSLCAVLILRYRGRGFFFICWGLLSLAPTLVVPLNVLVNEHRLYALIAAAGVGLSLEWQGWRSHVKWALCGWVCVVAMLTQERNQVWEDERSLWEDSARKSPGMARPQVFLGNALREAGERADAKARYERALQIDPSQRSARTNLANIYLEAARTDSANRPALLARAQMHYLRVLEAEPDYREALTNLGSLYMMQGAWEEAEALFSRTIEKHPHYADAYYNWAMIKVQQGAFAEAVSLFLRALDWEQSAELWYELGNGYARLDQLDRAIDAYRRALALDGRAGHIWYNFAEVLLVAGERAGAVRGSDRGLALWKEAEEALEHLLSVEVHHARGRQRLLQLRERMP